jgi:flagellar protein FliS
MRPPEKHPAAGEWRLKGTGGYGDPVLPGGRVKVMIECCLSWIKKVRRMLMYGAKAYGQYQKMQVNTASPGQLVLMLYDAAGRWARDGAAAFEAEELEKGHGLLIKAQEAVAELASGLNMEAGGAIAENLAQLYDYMYRRLVEANVKKDPGAAEEVAGLLSGLREAWSQVLQEGNRQLRAAGGLNVGG